jgi:hypothetical protein
MIHHRFINDGRSPIPMGGSAEYACVCGKRGTHAAVERHIAVENDREAVPVESQRPDTDSDNFGGGNTKANYFPHEPRRPAPTGEAPPLQRPDRPETPAPLPPPPATVVNTCPRCGIGQPTCDLPEISAWSCGHWIEKRPRSIAELFQDMLRSAFQAGAAATMAGESFETWYQREVLR